MCWKKAVRHENKRGRWVRSYWLIQERDEVAWTSLTEEEVMRSGPKETGQNRATWAEEKAPSWNYTTQFFAHLQKEPNQCSGIWPFWSAFFLLESWLKREIIWKAWRRKKTSTVNFPLQSCRIYLDAFLLQPAYSQLHPHRAKPSDVLNSECVRLTDIIYKWEEILRGQGKNRTL